MPNQDAMQIVWEEISYVELRFTLPKGQFPKKPNLGAANKVTGVTATSTANTVTLKLDANKSWVWGDSRKLAGQAIADALGGRLERRKRQ